MPMPEEEECCLTDALLADVVELARKRRQDIRSAYTDPEEAFIDAYVAGWFDGHFHNNTPSTPATTSIAEEDQERCALFSSYGL